ncbi:hypothetical protein HLB23_38525 [Nocardia uniformis]|uniref:Uncharacterized protein n=1 Tax=Nocardia uniformis TaxID=53432 RepID=A0A849CA21_9NOCA|nr:hypothetical protein [Nocardia uniformis]NNH75683.1 hypothetical protein [Nocardia uniformis]
MARHAHMDPAAPETPAPEMCKETTAMTDTTATPAPSDRHAAGRTDLELCPIHVGGDVYPLGYPSVRGRVTYVEDYPDGLIECVVELTSEPGRIITRPWQLRPADDTDPQSVEAAMSTLITAQRITAERVLGDKQQRALAAAQELARDLAMLIDDLEHDREPACDPDDWELDELRESLSELSQFRTETAELPE